MKNKLPDESALNIPQKRYDYVDVFMKTVEDPKNKITSTDLGKAFFGESSPKWINLLMTLRNNIVSVFGLKTSRKEKNIEDFKCEVGERMGVFEVFSKTDKEVVLGENDKHLDFRVSLFLEPNGQAKNIFIATVVTYNHWFGRFYFSIIKHFHRLIVPSMLKRIVKEMERKALI
ncbi:DUF2867 domain-containing protein [Capnocytophaga canimorsus]|uniref:DUF2867 domain-containing protein n=1 Tax=Capnocytophaga canimorsus TaxID=28188 RepID=UPI0037D192A5